MSWGLTLQICLIIALSFCCRCWRFGFVNGLVSLAWSIALRTQELYTRPRVLKERLLEERTGSRSLNFFQAVFTRVVVESSQPPAAESSSRPYFILNIWTLHIHIPQNLSVHLTTCWCLLKLLDDIKQCRPYQMPHLAASDWGLNCLLRPVSSNTEVKSVRLAFSASIALSSL